MNHGYVVRTLQILGTILIFTAFCQSQTDSWERTNFPFLEQINTITTNASGHIFVGTTNGAYRSLDDGSTWAPLNIDSTKNNISYLTTGPNEDLYASTSDHLYRSTDNGNIWTRMNTDPSVKWFNKIAFDAQGNIYCCGATLNAGVVCRSTDGGKNWVTVLNTINYGAIRSIAIDSHNNIFVIGTEDILSSNDQGATWNRLLATHDGISSYYAQALVIDRNDVVYVGTGGGGVMRSKDNGAHWSWQRNGLADQYVTSLLASRSGIIFAETSNGIYVSANQGDEWSGYFSGIVSSSYRLQISERGDGTVFVGARDGSLYRSARQTTRFMVDSKFRRQFCAANGTAVFDSIIVRNQSTSSLSISSITVMIPRCSIEPTDATVPAGGSIVFRLRSSPGSPALLDGAVVFHSNSFLSHDTILVQLFAGVPFLSYSSRFIDFGAVHRREVKDLPILLANPGYDTLIAQTEILPNQHFQIFPSSFQIPPLGSVELTVRFTADTIANIGIKAGASSQMNIHSNSPLTPDIFYLTGTSYGLLAVKDMSVAAEKYSLEQNYPNPFNPSTTITFSIQSKSHVSLKVLDVMGREVSTIVSDVLPAGTYQRQWNASGMPSGMYFYRLQAGAYTEAKRLVVVK